jgi:hypothetical protein
VTLQRKLRDCAMCGEPVIARPYQSDEARTCTPVCAKELALKEHPDIDAKRNTRLLKLARIAGLE